MRKLKLNKKNSTPQKPHHTLSAHGATMIFDPPVKADIQKATYEVLVCWLQEAFQNAHIWVQLVDSSWFALMVRSRCWLFLQKRNNPTLSYLPKACSVLVPYTAVISFIHIPPVYKWLSINFPGMQDHPGRPFMPSHSSESTQYTVNPF